MSYILKLLAIAMMSVLFAACGGSGQSNAAQPENTDNSAPSSDTSDMQPDDVVATVNDEEITRAEFDIALERRLQAGEQLPRQQIEQQVLDTLIEQTLIEQAAPELGVEITEEDVDAELQKLRDAVTDDAEWTTFLELNGYTEETMRAAQRESLITQRVRDALSQELMGAVPQVRARHILVRTEAEAEQVLQRLQNGESFEALAAELSADMTSKDNGGSLGWFTRGELTDANLSNVAFDLEAGQIAGPVPSPLGYHIIQTMEKAEREIEPERLPVLVENRLTEWLAEQFQQATIERYI